MRPASAKAKGRRGVQDVRDALLAAAPELNQDDIRVVPSGVPGEDLWLSPAAQARFPFTIEVKNQERLQVWEALAQAEQHANKNGRTPVLCFRRNRSRVYVALPLDQFLTLTRK